MNISLISYLWIHSIFGLVSLGQKNKKTVLDSQFNIDTGISQIYQNTKKQQQLFNIIDDKDKEDKEGKTDPDYDQLKVNINNENIIEGLKMNNLKFDYEMKYDNQPEKIDNGIIRGIRQELCILNQDQLIEHINMKRMLHNTHGLNYSQQLENIAKIKVNQIVNTNCNMNTKIQYNLLYSIYSLNQNEIVTEEQQVDKWYEGWYYMKMGEIKNQTKYNYYLQTHNPKNILLMLWNSTQQIGCWMGCCTQTNLIVCELFPIQNYYNYTLFNKNVLIKE